MDLVLMYNIVAGRWADSISSTPSEWQIHHSSRVVYLLGSYVYFEVTPRIWLQKIVWVAAKDGGNLST